MARHRDRQPFSKALCQGTSLIEVMVALLVISLALFGAVALQLRAVQLGQSSQRRDQAIVLAADLGERMEANKTAAVSGAAYVIAPTSAAPAAVTTCSNTCTPAEVAAQDLYQWQTTVASMLPQSAWAVRQIVSGNPSSYETTIQWADGRGDAPAGNDAALRSSYIATRTVYRP